MVYISAKNLPDHGLAIEHDSFPIPIVHDPHRDTFHHRWGIDSSNNEVDSWNGCIDWEHLAVWTRNLVTLHLANCLAGKPMDIEYFDNFNDEIDHWSPFSWEEEYWVA